MAKTNLGVTCLLTTLMAAPAAWAAEESPYLQPDGSWISLSGTVVETFDDSFILDYGMGSVRVEMDDWDWYGEHRAIIENDRVTVYGEVDDETFEAATVDADSIYVENLGTYFYAESADEDTYQVIDMSPTTPIVVGDMTATGTITAIDGREFTLDSGIQRMTVDTTGLPYNPMDDKGFQQLDMGDTVTVTGYMDRDVFAQRELVAESIVTLNEEGESGS
ncbi:MAG: NirD/YgiW/YdeI family stress tolerance protein [Marinobacter sp.]|uniref:NirD/YgiW/YdeI family stress tolerance protein n=1 Tax=Marinobacter sp. TaxID=50741 RepID=UPI00299EBD5B|nr:NirD/YgiW/YdeI family stress tolerance protein [Marinobacter sp.]MDX1634397.1 NirD/YgiW/YdeI family stress tolerance protein [Marinobacter sp.]